MTELSLLHKQFIAVSKDLPDQRAVVTPQGEITYRDLDEASSVLAKDLLPFLHRAGRVLICLDPGVEFITAMLAVLKAGAAYAPLHRGDPAGRITAMSALPGADLLITDPEMKQRLGNTPRLPVHTISELQSASGASPRMAGQKAPLPKGPGSYGGRTKPHAYIIHTSGSTGTPKAIGISHAALVNLLAAFDEFSPLGSNDRCALWSALHFDVSVYEIWSALLSGATLFIPEETRRFSPDGFLGWMVEQRITSAYVPPFMLEAMAKDTGDFRLKRMLTGVEPAPEPLLCRIKQNIPGLTLINGYGPAEATVCATLYPVPDVPSRQGRAPIGKAVRNLTIDLVDEKGQTVPKGENGEIIIRGIQVSDGYLNAPGQNAHAFDNEGPQPAYRTGDVGRELPDGNILFLGRKDFQIKFRGIRIEPGEIEGLLRKQPEISQAALIFKELPGGSPGLLAYVTPRSGKGLDTEKVIEDLRQVLPRTMMPAAIVCLDRMPVTSQGKTDRQALAQRQDPELSSSRTQEGPGRGHDPGSPEQTRVAEIWEQVLKSPVRSGDENFLLLGGDSIAATAIMARINEAFGLNLPLNLLFEFPEFHRFTRHILTEPQAGIREPQTKDGGTAPLSPKAPIPLMTDQELIWLFETLYPKTTVYHIPLVFEIAGDLDPVRLERAINRAIVSHPALGFVFTLNEDRVFQQWTAPKIRLSLHDLESQEPNLFFRLDDPGIRKWLDREIRRPFNLARGPLIRAALLKVAPGQYTLCFTIHHLVFDGWSAGLFIRTLNRVYTGLAEADQQGKAPGALPDPGPGIARYHDHVLYKKRQLFRQWTAARSFFSEYLSDLPSLPPHESETDFTAACCPISIDISLYVKLKALARQQRTSSFAVLLAILQITMALKTEQKDQVTGIAYAGRDRLASETIAGCLMNTLVVRNKIPFRTSFLRFLGQMKKTLETILGYRDIPFHTLQAYCQKQGQPHEILDTLFLMQTMPLEPLNLGNLETRYHSESSGHANTGMILELYERPTGATGRLKFRTNRYTEPQARQLVRTFTEVTALVIDHPNESLETLTADILEEVPNEAQITRELEEILSAPRFPLSPMQHGMLMETLRAPQGAGCYVEQVVFEMEEEIDVSQFSQAWNQVVTLHETLRLGFTWKGKEHPEQYLSPPEHLKIEFNDWSHISEDEKQEYLDMFIKADRRLGFSLDNPPAFRIALFKTNAARFTCVWSFHHSIGDGRSMAFILRHLFQIYKNPGMAMDAPPSFRHYIAWLHGRHRGKSRQFWRQYLSGFTEPMIFPFRIDPPDSQVSRRQPHAMSLATGHHHFTLSPVTCRAIKTLCQRHKLSINAFLMGAWAVLLSHYTGRTDVLFGATVSTRHFDTAHREGTGLYINTLPIRISIKPDQPLISYISDIRSQWKDIRSHDHLSLTEIHALSPIQGSSPLSEIYFSYDYQTLDEALSPYKKAVSCTQVRLLERTPAAIFLTATGTDTLKLSIEYDRRKFNARTTRQILEHFSVFLKSCSQKPNSSLLDLPVLTERETLLIQEKLNTGQGHLPPTSCFHQLFEIQSGINHSAPAVTDGKTLYTYGRLNSLANQVAHLLIRQGAGPNQKILLLLEQNPDLIAVILGVMKSGACYVPLETTAPRERIQRIIADCSPDFVITVSAHEDKLGPASAQRILMDKDRDRIDRQPTINPMQNVSPDHLAYIIYTSGSTGTPKGVMIEHQSLAAFTKTAAQIYEIEPIDRMLQFATISFDASIEEIFPTLYAGATLVVKPRELVQTPQAFFSYCREMELSIIDLPTAYWHMLAEEINGLELPPALRLVIIGGDAADPTRVRKWQSAVGGKIRLINTYGPTETTVVVTKEDLSETVLETDIVPIGVPFPSVNLSILNHFGQPAPPGVTGELFIGGPQVSRGYLNREKETAAAFIDDLPHHHKIRFYRTGDRARMLPSGKVLFMGRLDRQVKIRGYRVEPKEIEATAMAYTGVKHAGVIIDKGKNEPVIHIFLEPTVPGQDLKETKDFLAWIKPRLPDYMIPSHIHVIVPMPHVTSGKIDYNELKLMVPDMKPASPPASPVVSGTEADTESTLYESRLLKIWSEVLNKADLDREDNFFDVGGSSLTAIRLISAIEKEFIVSLPVLAIFRAPVLKDLALLISRKNESQNLSNARLIKTGSNGPPIFFIAGTDEDTDAYAREDLKGHPFYTVTVFAHKREHQRIVSMDLWEIARKSVQDILAVSPNGPYIIIGFCRYSIAAYEIASQLVSMGKAVQTLIFIDEFWQERGMTSFVSHHMKGMAKFGIRSVLKKIIPKTREKIHMQSLKLDRLREKCYTKFGIAVPEHTQYRLMEAAFWDAYTAYLPLPYQGGAIVLDTTNWKEKYAPKLRNYIKGRVKRIEVQATHRDWFKPAQIQAVINAVEEGFRPPPQKT